MNSSNEVRELEKLSKGLAPKSGCKICRVILIVAVILFISSLLLVAFTLGKSSKKEAEIPPHVSTADETNNRFQVLRNEVRNQLGSTTIIRSSRQTK